MALPHPCLRSSECIAEAIGLAREGSYVDLDTVDQKLARNLQAYLDGGGPADRLTVSSDADSGAPDILYDQLTGLVLEQDFPLELMLSFCTRNTADVLKLEKKGRLDAGMDADLLVLEKRSLEIVEVIAQGKRMVREGAIAVSEKFLDESHRNVRLMGRLFDRSTTGLADNQDSMCRGSRDDESLTQSDRRSRAASF